MTFPYLENYELLPNGTLKLEYFKDRDEFESGGISESKLTVKAITNLTGVEFKNGIVKTFDFNYNPFEDSVTDFDLDIPYDDYVLNNIHYIFMQFSRQNLQQ